VAQGRGVDGAQSSDFAVGELAPLKRMYHLFETYNLVTAYSSIFIQFLSLNMGRVFQISILLSRRPFLSCAASKWTRSKPTLDT
jgi:hypothetical protein